MNPIDEPLGLLAAALAGLLLGAAFFGGLWWTVRRAMASAQPALWHLASSLVRTGVAVAGFYWVGATSWQRLLACLAGFVLGRMLVIRWTGAAVARSVVTARIDDAPQP